MRSQAAEHWRATLSVAARLDEASKRKAKGTGVEKSADASSIGDLPIQRITPGRHPVGRSVHAPKRKIHGPPSPQGAGRMVPVLPALFKSCDARDAMECQPQLLRLKFVPSKGTAPSPGHVDAIRVTAQVWNFTDIQRSIANLGAAVWESGKFSFVWAAKRRESAKGNSLCEIVVLYIKQDESGTLFPLSFPYPKAATQQAVTFFRYSGKVGSSTCAQASQTQLVLRRLEEAEVAAFLGAYTF